MGPCRPGQGRLVLMPQKRSINSGSLTPAAPPDNAAVVYLCIEHLLKTPIKNVSVNSLAMNVETNGELEK